MPAAASARGDWSDRATRLWISPAPAEAVTIDLARRAKLLRELEQEFVPDHDALSMPSADKRAAYALGHIAFRFGKIEESLAKIATAIQSILAQA